MKKLLSQVAQLVGAAAETVAKHAKGLSDSPEAPAPAPSPRAESLVHVIACDSCRAQYDVTGYASSSLRCRCGHLIQVRAPTAIQRAIQRCGACGGPLEDGATACRFCGGHVERDALKLTLLCPECFAANPRRCQFCCSCGVELAPEPVGAAKPTHHACPVCAKPLFERRLGNTWVEECNECHGLFIAVTHLEHLVQHAARAQKSASVPAPVPAPLVPASGVVLYRRCPECNQLMQRRNYGRASGVIVDECRMHGHWLDANELEAIGRFISSGEQQQVRLRETQDALRAAEAARQQARERPDPRAARRQSFVNALWGDDD
jgi:Zn-finger nucleic acid-binding protein